MINLTKKKRSLSALLAVTSALAIMSASVSALASSITASKTVQLVEASAGAVIIQLSDGVNYLGQLTTQAGCTANNQSADTLKAWTSLAQTALLSGKLVNVYFNTCNGTNYVVAVDLKQ